MRQCGTSSNHVALLLSSLFLHLRALPLVVPPFVPLIHFPTLPSPRAFIPLSTIRAARRKIMLLPPTSVHPRTPSQRRNQRCVTRGNGRKEEGSDRHFQARSTKRRQKRCPAIIPKSGRPATVSWMSFSRYVSTVSYRDFLSTRASRVPYPIKDTRAEGLYVTRFCVFLPGRSAFVYV